MRKPIVPVPEEFPVPFHVFAREMVGTENEVWIKLMQNHFGQTNMRPAEWRKALETLKG